MYGIFYILKSKGWKICCIPLKQACLFIDVSCMKSTFVLISELPDVGVSYVQDGSRD